jgi:ATP-dependent Zn protease
MGTPSKKQRQDLNSIVSLEDIQFLPSSSTSSARSTNAGNVANTTLTPKKRKKAATGQIMSSDQSNVPTSLSENASQVSFKIFFMNFTKIIIIIALINFFSRIHHRVGNQVGNCQNLPASLLIQ